MGLTKTNQSVGSDNQIDFIPYFLCIGDEMLEEVYDLKKVCKIKFWNKSLWCVDRWIWCVNFDIVELSCFAVDSLVNLFSINFDEVLVISIADVSLMNFNLVDAIQLQIFNRSTNVIRFVMQGGIKNKLLWIW